LKLIFVVATFKNYKRAFPFRRFHICSFPHSISISADHNFYFYLRLAFLWLTTKPRLKFTLCFSIYILYCRQFGMASSPSSHSLRLQKPNLAPLLYHPEGLALTECTEPAPSSPTRTQRKKRRTDGFVIWIYGCFHLTDFEARLTPAPFTSVTRGRDMANAKEAKAGAHNFGVSIRREYLRVSWVPEQANRDTLWLSRIRVNKSVDRDRDGEIYRDFMGAFWTFGWKQRISYGEKRGLYYINLAPSPSMWSTELKKLFALFYVIKLW